MLVCLARGDTYVEAAKKLGVGRQEVQTFVKSIYRKLHINTQRQARHWALTHGLRSLDK